MVAKRDVSYEERASGSRAAQRAGSVVQLPLPTRKGFLTLHLARSHPVGLPPCGFDTFGTISSTNTKRSVIWWFCKVSMVVKVRWYFPSHYTMLFCVPMPLQRFLGSRNGSLTNRRRGCDMKRYAVVLGIACVLFCSLVRQAEAGWVNNNGYWYYIGQGFTAYPMKSRRIFRNGGLTKYFALAENILLNGKSEEDGNTGTSVIWQKFRHISKTPIRIS
jgi:hypothetical protein